MEGIWIRTVRKKYTFYRHCPRTPTHIRKLQPSGRQAEYGKISLSGVTVLCVTSAEEIRLSKWYEVGLGPKRDV
jgi:hypothetical protein